MLYNWGINNIYGGDGGNYNLVNNFYKYGPVTSSGVKYRIVGVDSSATYGYAKYFLSGNYVDGSPTNTANNWSGAGMNTGNPADTVKSKLYSPVLNNFPLTTQTASDAYESVLNGAGAVLPRRDTLDRRIVNDVRFRVGRLVDVQGGYPHGTPYAQTVNAWPTLNSTTAPVDTDHDGMPDAWETANGLDPNNAADRQTVAGNGYTNLENYLNQITNTSPELTFAGVLNNFSQPTAAPSAVQTLTVSGTRLTGNVTLTAPAHYEISIDGGTTWVNSTSSITLTPAAGNLNNVTLSIRLNSANPGNYAGNIVATTPGQSNFYVLVTTGNVVVTPPNSGPAVATWTLLSNPEPTVSGSILAANQTLGSAISGTQYGSTFGGVSGWQRSASTTSLPVGFSADSYVEYSVTAPSGKSFTDTSIVLSALGGGTGTARMAIYYSLDGFATSNSAGAITYNGVTYSNTTDNTNSVSLLNTSTTPLNGQQIATVSTNIVVASGQTLTIRIYVWITGSGTRYFASQNVKLEGYTTDGALPLKLISLSAQSIGKSNKLTWVTANESNMKNFEVELSSDASNYRSIGTVAATNNLKTTYNFVDENAGSETKYYRLRMVNKDGSSTSSYVVVVKRNNNAIAIYPNPAHNVVTISHPAADKKQQMVIINAEGKVIKTIMSAAGATQTIVDVSAISTGLYLLKFSNGSNEQTIKFIKN